MKTKKIMALLLAVSVVIIAGFTGASTVIAADNDMMVTAVKPVASTVYDGDEVSYTATVRNIGGETLAGDFSVSFYSDGRLLQSISCTDRLASNGVKTVTTTATVDISFGSHKVVAIVNQAGELEETDYSNNKMASRFLVSEETNPNPPVVTPPIEEGDDEIRYSGNPIITSIFTADPSAHVWANDPNKLYVYASHDNYPSRGCDLMDRYHIFSTTDMVTWVDEGEILGSDDVEWGRSDGGFMWAPDAAYKDGTYYFYYPHPTGNGDAWNSTWKIGVATSNKPAADFVDQGYIEDLAQYSLIDPCVFQDDDGKNYIYIGGGNVCKGGQLGDDMMSVPNGMADMEGLEDFHEGTWVFKRNGIYYLMYADNYAVQNPDGGWTGMNRQRYAMSTSPLGPWEYKGIILDSNNCDTSHGSTVEFKGNYYIFYHNADVSNGNGTLRSIAVDKLEFNDDGTIKPVTQTKQGVQSVAKKPAVNPNIKSYTTPTVGGGATINTNAGSNSGVEIGNLHIAGSYAEYTGIDGGNGGQATIHVYYATQDTEAKMKLTVNGKDYGYINMMTTGSWASYSGHAYITVKLDAGTNNTIKLEGGTFGLNLDYIAVEPRG